MNKKQKIHEKNMQEKVKRKNRKIFASVLVVAAVFAVLFGLKLFQSSDLSKNDQVYSRILGNKKSPIRIIEYADFQCPPCAKGFLMLKKYFEKDPENFNIEFKYHPWTHQRHALKSAIYAECAAEQGKFWEYAQLLFERQKSWKQEIEAEIIFRTMSQEVGLDESKLGECVIDEKTEKKILSEKERGTSMGISQTPTYYVNGKMVVGVNSLLLEIGGKLEDLAKKKASSGSDCDSEASDVCSAEE